MLESARRQNQVNFQLSARSTWPAAMPWRDDVGPRGIPEPPDQPLRGGCWRRIEYLAIGAARSNLATIASWRPRNACIAAEARAQGAAPKRAGTIREIDNCGCLECQPQGEHADQDGSFSGRSTSRDCLSASCNASGELRAASTPTPRARLPCASTFLKPFNNLYSFQSWLPHFFST